MLVSPAFSSIELIFTQMGEDAKTSHEAAWLSWSYTDRPLTDGGVFLPFGS